MGFIETVLWRPKEQEADRLSQIYYGVGIIAALAKYRPKGITIPAAATIWTNSWHLVLPRLQSQAAV